MVEPTQHWRNVPTERQTDVLRAIHRYTHAYGYAPSIRELGDLLGIHSTNGVADHLRLLVAKGLLLRGPKNTARSLRLTNHAANLVAP